jgi:hypothetical protein
MSKPPSETRVLLLILGVIGLLSCGCLCVPLGLLGLGIGLPAAVQVRKAADRVAKNARMRAEAPPVFAPEAAPDVSAGFPPQRPTAVPQFTPPQFTPPEFTPPQFTPPPVNPPVELPPIPPEFGGPPSASAQPAAGKADGGRDSLTESRKRFLHQTATIHRTLLERIEMQRAEAQQRGQKTDFYDRMLTETKTRLKEQLDRLCESHNLTREELDQIIAEGDRQGWSGRSARKK